jgi:hypothetical protein
MSTRYEPRRLADLSASDDAVAAAIMALRDEAPSATQIDTLARRLASQLATPVVAASTSAGLAGWLKGLCGLALSFAIGAYVMSHAGRSKPAPRHAVVNAAAPVAVPRVIATPAPIVEPAKLQPTRAKPAIAPARVRTPPRRSAPEAAAAAPTPESELVLLERSRAALDRDPASALALAEAHARSHPSGIFAQEREMLAIEALLKLKRKAEARARAERFVQRYPDSPQAPRVRAWIERTPPPAADPHAVPESDQR